jgi:hypothetical protein
MKANSIYVNDDPIGFLRDDVPMQDRDHF